MGIPYYYTYLIKKYNKKILIPFSTTNTTAFIDSNSIIYDVCREYNNDEDIINATCKKLNEYIEVFDCELTYITFDGLPPMAKIKQQRERRYKSYITKELLKSEIKWDTCSITTGSEFMKNLTIKLKKEKFINNVKLSSSDEPGEGEHKIFEYIRKNSNYLKDKNVLIYGLDADLIMLSLHHLKYVKNIYLYRETPEFIEKLKVNIDVNEKYLINVDELKKIIEETCPINDYIFICFLLGNDFMPHFPTLNIRKEGIQNLLNIYNTLNIKLIDNDNNISWNNVRIFINELYKNEVTSYKYLYSKIYPKTPHAYESNEEILNNLPSIDKKTEQLINPNNDKWKYNYYKNLFDRNIENEPDFINTVCLNYIEGLEWTYKYYIGKDIDYNWYYKYHYPPLFCDLVKFIPFYNHDFIKYKPHEFNEMMQLCYVLPYGSLNLIPSNIRIKLNLNWYQSDCNIEWAYCKYFWESHPHLPIIDVNELKLIAYN